MPVGCLAAGAGTQRYLPMDRTDEEALTEAMIAQAIEYGRYGYRRIAVKLREAETLAAAYRGGALSVRRQKQWRWTPRCRRSDRPSDRARIAADGHRAVGRASEEKRIAFAAVSTCGWHGVRR